MKYIRTKDGIQALYIDEFTEYGKEYYKNCKIADTIEELCDEFIVRETKHKDHWFCSTLKEIKNVIEWKGNLDGWEYYGAIWTEKGLIFVAKMNKKGKFELL